MSYIYHEKWIWLPDSEYSSGTQMFLVIYVQYFDPEVFKI